MGIDGLGAHMQHLCDLGAGVAFGDQNQDLTLAVCQLLKGIRLDGRLALTEGIH